MNSIDLSGLTPAEKEKVRIMLSQGYAFAAENDDIGNVDTVKMKINKKDNISCQATHNSIPQPLHQERKHYIGDLLNRK